MAKKRIFKTDFGAEETTLDPEALFRDLKGRAQEIKHLWSHQADLLRAYHTRHVNTSDVAIELPTGAGKTLVGLLIAEFRRRSLAERVVYLCPTRQLAHQVGAQAAKYGIKGHVFVGRQHDYPPKEFGEYQESKAIAVTTYSGVFNSNPRISDAQTLILDDAHASENYIASMWSVQLIRHEVEGLYDAFVSLFADALPSAFLADITREEDSGLGRNRIVEVVPGKYLRRFDKSLRDLLEERIIPETSPWYAWQAIKEHLVACNVYICRDSILIRPLMPPARTHLPFANASQRVYMSATLGAGGELERITGIGRIERLPLPPGWDKRGSGRRLFLAPQVALSDESAIDVVLSGARDVDRSLVLVPNQFEASAFEKRLADYDTRVLRASDIEDSINPFTTTEKVALVLSRYDGLDLPDEACRLLVMGGLPGGTNIQERFLLSRIAATSLLRDRLLTRFTQGVGRCTRSDNDYAVVMLWGSALVDFILRVENRRTLHPELQAELEFGIANSREKSPAQFAELWQTFLDQGEEWEAAEEAIISLRETKTRQLDPVTERLRAVVGDEVGYLYAMWNGDFETALQKAKAVADGLGGDETKGYRGWWYYLVGDAALILHEESGKAEFLGVARDCLRRAANCCLAVSWFAHLARQDGSVLKSDDASGTDELSAMAVEAIQDRLANWGLAGGRFEKDAADVLANLKSTEHKRFCWGLRDLGRMLGFRAKIPEGGGAPDCVWSLGDALHVAHEAKTEHTPKNPIGVKDVRQAQSHADWVAAHLPSTADTQVVCVIESPRNSILEDAVPHAKTLCHMFPIDVLTIAEEISAVLRRVRALASDLGSEALLEKILAELKAAKLRPKDVLTRLSIRPVSGMPVIS